MPKVPSSKSSAAPLYHPYSTTAPSKQSSQTESHDASSHENMVSDIKQRYLNYPLTVGVIGASFNGGQPRGGVEQGPARLVEFGLINQLKKMNWKVDFDEKFPTYDHLKHHDSDDVGMLKNARLVSKVTKNIKESVESICRSGSLALTLGGDHSIAIGTISGSAAVYPDLGVIWVDAHADINTPETTTSGNLHGCPVAFLMGLAGQVESFEWLSPCLKPDRIVYIGLRDIDAPEKKILKDHKIKAFSMHDVDRHGIGKLMEMALDYLGRDKPIHMSFDVDAMDPSVAPATGTPVRGGLTFREGHFICEIVHETGCLVALDIAEVNPELGDQHSLIQTVQVGCSLVRSALGETLL